MQLAVSDAPFFFVLFPPPSPAERAFTVEPPVQLPQVRASSASSRVRAHLSLRLLAEMASILLSHPSQSFIAAHPPTLALALAKARYLFPDLVNIALTARFGARCFEVTEDAWETRALKEDLVEFIVVEKVARGLKREREKSVVAGRTGRGAGDREGAKEGEGTDRKSVV